LVDFGFEELCDEREEDVVEDGGEEGAGAGDEFLGCEGLLERDEGLLADLAAGVETLVGEGFEDWVPVCCPCCFLLVKNILAEGTVCSLTF
jgi:hypothetical protein